jgi:hypothetical protein
MGINKSAPCFCQQLEDLVIPHIGPEFIAALRNKAAGRDKAVLGVSLMKPGAAKTARSLMARFVSRFGGFKAKKTGDSQPPSTQVPAPSHCSQPVKDTLHLDRIVVVIDAEEMIHLYLPLGGEGSTK